MKYLRSLSCHVYRFISVHGADGKEAELHEVGRLCPIRCQEFAIAKNAVSLHLQNGGKCSSAPEGRQINNWIAVLRRVCCSPQSYPDYQITGGWGGGGIPLLHYCKF